MRSPEIGRQEACYHVRFGSETDICAAKGHVRFTPESDIQRVTIGCPLRAKSGHETLFDHLAGAREQRWGHAKAKSLGGPKVDCQLKLGRRLNRHISRLLTFQDSVDVTGRAAVLLEDIGSVRNQSAAGDIKTCPVYCGQPVASRERDDQLAITYRGPTRANN